MGKIIKNFPNGAFLEYDRGSFDEWCVYLTDASGLRKPPRDIDYFNQLKNLAEKFGTEKVYVDFVQIYGMTGKEVNNKTLDVITQISETYGDEADQVDAMFTILYMAMIAEERKAGTKLGKRIKRLGIYKLLYENKSVYESANFMRGMGWRDIARLCEQRGF